MNKIFNLPLKHAYSLVEMMTVVAIISIIGAIATPMYKKYVTETRVKSMWQEAESAKLAVSADYFKRYKTFDTINYGQGTTEFTTTATNFIKSINIVSGVVTVTGEPSKFGGNEIAISWSPKIDDEVLTWTCAYTGTDAEKYASEECNIYDCPSYSDWSSPTIVSNQELWYMGKLSLTDVKEEFAYMCNEGSWVGQCNTCYFYTNTELQRRYMTFELDEYTYSSNNWGWSYQYTYTISKQQCNQVTRTLDAKCAGKT